MIKETRIPIEGTHGIRVTISEDDRAVEYRLTTFHHFENEEVLFRRPALQTLERMKYVPIDD